MPNIADSFFRNVPNYDQVGTLRLGLSPSGSRRFMVMILVEVDDI